MKPESFELCADFIDKARELQLKILTLNACVTSVYGVSGLKAGMDMVGLYGGLPRLPLQPPSDEVKAAIKAELEKLGLMGKYNG